MNNLDFITLESQELKVLFMRPEQLKVDGKQISQNVNFNFWKRIYQVRVSIFFQLLQRLGVINKNILIKFDKKRRDNNNRKTKNQLIQ
jgi:hypothetical protein